MDGQVCSFRKILPQEPFVFSLLGRCRGLAGSQKYTLMSVRNIEDKRARQRAKAASKAEASQHGKLIEGTTTQGWNEALGALVIAFPERFEGHLNQP